jgi:hypothetical protein
VQPTLEYYTSDSVGWTMGNRCSCDITCAGDAGKSMVADGGFGCPGRQALCNRTRSRARRLKYQHMAHNASAPPQRANVKLAVPQDKGQGNRME